MFQQFEKNFQKNSPNFFLVEMNSNIQKQLLNLPDLYISEPHIITMIL